MTNYEIRLMKPNGTLSLLYATSCVSDEDAIQQAKLLVGMAVARAEIWQDARLIGEVTVNTSFGHAA